GLPKGAYADHLGFALWVNNVQLAHQRRPGDVELFFSPFFHATLVVCLLAPLYAGASVIIQPTFDAQRALAAVAQGGVTHLGGTPTVLQALIDVARDRPGVYDEIKRVVFGGTAVTPAFLDRLARSFPNAELTTSYGAT